MAGRAPWEPVEQFEREAYSDYVKPHNVTTRYVYLRNHIMDGGNKMKNPFEFGRELGKSELADRESEVRSVLETMRDTGRLFLIGPRRFGKTSILRAATDQARSEGLLVLRYNAEAFPTLSGLASAIVEDAAKAIGGPVRRMDAPGRSEEALLAEALDGVNRLVSDSGRSISIVIDEFQQVVERGGVVAEAQVRAAIQQHEHVAYVFAGSKTKMLAEMTGNAARPFYRLGARLFIGPVPRTDFVPFIRSRFEAADFILGDEAIAAILDLSADVPYNVQRLAHSCWAAMRETGAREMTSSGVREIAEQLVGRDDPFYTQTWNRLTRPQQKALLALTSAGDAGLFSTKTLGKAGLPQSTMQTALAALEKTGVTRREEDRGAVQYVLEDPFLKVWLQLFVVRD